MKFEIEPKIYNLTRLPEYREFRRLIKRKKIKIVDEYQAQSLELGLVKNPRLLLRAHKPKPPKKRQFKHGRWVYFPWKDVIVHILAPGEYSQLRLSRNRDLITTAEQNILAKLRIGIAGLNVGNPAALCLALEGIGAEFKFADNDYLSLSNLNRFRAGLADLGMNKAILSAQQVYETNPYLKISVYASGLDEQNLDQFLLDPKIDVLIEETDHLKLKIKIREIAKRSSVPVIMATGNGDGVIIDVERYDQKPELELLNGLLPKKVRRAITSTSTNLFYQRKILTARDFMGRKYLVPRLRRSFDLVGKTLAGIPQLAESSFLRGAAITYVVRNIFTGHIPSGRYLLQPNQIFSIK